jgi:hypothetical protein
MDKPSHVKLGYQTIWKIAKESRPGEPGRLPTKTIAVKPTRSVG